jgi:hypothetical protein
VQPWITSLYVDCPPNLVFDATPNETLRCPSKEEVGRYEDAIRRGDIVFQALPFNLQPEAMSPGLFEGALSRRRDCHSAAPPSPFSRRFNSDGEGRSAK